MEAELSPGIFLSIYKYNGITSQKTVIFSHHHESLESHNLMVHQFVICCKFVRSISAVTVGYLCFHLQHRKLLLTRESVLKEITTLYSYAAYCRMLLSVKYTKSYSRIRLEIEMMPVAFVILDRNIYKPR